MTPQPHPRVAWLLLALMLCCWVVTGRASWLQFDEEHIKVLQGQLRQIDGDVKHGKVTEEAGERMKGFITERIASLKEQLPVRRQWAKIGRADAQRDLACGKLRLYNIDRDFFPLLICGPRDMPIEELSRAMQELTGATILPIKTQLPFGPQYKDKEFWSLVARVDGYNEEVLAYLTARHGADIFERARSRARPAGEQMGFWGLTREGIVRFIEFLAVLLALLLFARLVELRKRRIQNSTRITVT